MLFMSSHYYYYGMEEAKGGVAIIGRLIVNNKAKKIKRCAAG